MTQQTTIGQLVLDRLHEIGVRHIFGVPGDYVLGLFKLIEQSPIKTVGTTREDCAGFAADAYARVNGVGAACVTYCVGGLNIVNAVACAYAERSPVVLLSGSPGLAERVRNPLLHHMVRDFSTQRAVFENVTVATAVLDDPLTAQREVERALAALMRYKRPVYIEVPRDRVHTPVRLTTVPSPPDSEASDEAALQEAVAEVREMLAMADRPVVLAGAEVHRFGVQGDLARLVERMNVPVATTLLGKSVIREDHPLYIGVYGGLIGRDEVLEFVDQADCLLMLGSILTDIDDVGVHATLLAQGRTIHATADAIMIKHHRYDSVRFEDFVRALATAPMPSFPSRPLPDWPAEPEAAPAPGSPVTLEGLFAHLNGQLDEDTTVVADVGEALFASADLRVHRSAEFLAPAYYTSMGFAIPGALGAACADPSRRPIVLVGDGAFQMTGTELSTCLRQRLAPVVIVLNNRGYSTEREMVDGPFNDVQDWRYERVCDLIGGGVGVRVATHEEFAAALGAALADPKRPYLLNVLLNPADRSRAMVRLARRLARRISLDRE
jgi:indolepyruvate decarboxylase